MQIKAPLVERLQRWRTLAPGLVVCATVALASQFIADQYGAPAMLMALLLGIAFNFLGEDGRCVPGIDFASQTLLRIAVALLGMRISVGMLIELGPTYVGLVVLATVATILCALLIARLLGRGWRLALVTGGSVAICGASAAVAVAAVLPTNKNSERNLVFTVMSVAILSTIAMIAYPIFTKLLEMDDQTAGLFLGGSIHDVAQVVGAGFSISEPAGNTATLVKLIRVAMLAPLVIILSLVLRSHYQAGADQKRPPLLPAFVVVFLALATLNSLHLLPASAVAFAGGASKWGLLAAIAGVGMRTSLKTIQEIGRTAIILVVAETLFLACFLLAGLRLLA